ncbi:BirA family biotin operon repressor/biotin-[acetyl-CoA-carboxylase] ligase [Knoellia remsis]|uniref:biotin--[biotin carboxyl-carrier protein] ligase n=2 Tax=Knoellia remsis TaxID=407159 RepID=A0A2T0UD95_9MICO|nr:BirA family biotin operon repressor/biotin-[acetyl-CoA-carboxylase] ligase [Knoellia remsis]
MNATLVTPGSPWRPVEVHESVDSTNAEILRGDPTPWRVVTAEEQRAGRGRLDRGWTTTPGTSIAASVLLPRPTNAPLGWVPLVVGLALRSALTETSGLPVDLKWPNDLQAPTDGQRKLAGILAELTPHGVVVGTGVNIDTERADLPADTATSLRAAGAPGVSREAVLTAYLRSLATLWGTLQTDPYAVRAAYAAACTTLGREVVVHLPSESVRATATDVDADGRLCLTTKDGVRAVAAGDVVHVR